VAEGLKVVAAALDAGVPIESVYLAAEGRTSGAVEDLAGRAFERGARVFELGPGLMERVADTVSPQPICAVVQMNDRPLADLLLPSGDRPGEGRVILVCVDVRDPGNLGAVLRSAAAAGTAGVVCCDGCADVFNPKAVRASAGAVFHVPVARGGDAGTVLPSFREAGWRLLGTSARAGTSYLEADLAGDVALVLGNEASGLPGELDALMDGVVTVPMATASESLNVAMTATILVFEIARRRGEVFDSKASEGVRPAHLA